MKSPYSSFFTIDLREKKEKEKKGEERKGKERKETFAYTIIKRNIQDIDPALIPKVILIPEHWS